MISRYYKLLTNKLIENKLCYACTRNLNRQKVRESITSEKEFVRCKCDQLYIYDKLKKQYALYQDRKNKLSI